MKPQMFTHPTVCLIMTGCGINDYTTLSNWRVTKNLRNTQVQIIKEDVVDDCVADVPNHSSYDLRPYNSL